jgi:hypothetical protein
MLPGVVSFALTLSGILKLQNQTSQPMDVFQRLKSRLKMPNDRAVLLICIGIALLFWIFVKLSQSYNSQRNVRLEYHLPIGKDFITQPPDNVTAMLYGSGWDLLKCFLFCPNPVVVFDLSENPTPEVQRNELISKIREIVSVEVSDLSRNYISLAMGSTQTKSVPVALVANIDYAPDFFPVDSVRLIPASITISGPNALLENITSIETKPVRLLGVKGNLRRVVQLQMPESLPLRFSQTYVEVLIETEQFTEKLVTVPVNVSHGSDSIRIFPTQVELTCVVGLSRFEEITKADFTVEADLHQVSENPYENIAPLTLKSSPRWVKSVRFSPKAVEFFIVQ